MTNRELTNRGTALLLELKRRADTVATLRKSVFKEQLAFIDDRAKLKAVKCTRRAGKSYGCAGIYMAITCIENPGCNCLYMATTRESAKKIILKDILKVIDKKHNLQVKVNHTLLEVLFPNGSMIYIVGLDSSPEEMEKALGLKYKLCIIDEAGSWRQDQEELVHSILEPACADEDGTICMLGTPKNFTRSYFFRITFRKGLPGWSYHEWSYKQNPHTCKQVEAQIARMVAVNPRVVETPAFRQMYLGEWVVESNKLCYKYEKGRNQAVMLPQGHQWFHVLGLDLGFNDATAFVISAYSPTCPEMYIVKVVKQKALDITGVAQYLAGFDHEYRPIKWIVDGASKQAVEELRNRHGFPLLPADKTGKADFIEIMNADFIMGKIKLLPGADPLEEEYENLIWDDKSQKREEHPGCENHGADGALYSWRECFHHRAAPPKPKILPGSEEEMDLMADREAMIEKRKFKRDFAMRDFGDDYGFH